MGDDGSIFGRRLKEARDRKDVSQRQLGFRIGLERSGASTRINRYERGTRNPAFKIVSAIAQDLNVSPSFFYEPDDLLAEMILLAGKMTEPERRTLVATMRKQGSHQ